MLAKRITLLMFAVMLFALPLITFGQETIVYDQIVRGEITQNTPNVSYLFNGVEGDAIIIRMTATGELTLDSFLTLLDTDGNFYYSDDDSGGMRNALIGPVILPTTGTYTIIASSCCDASVAVTTGTYQLVVEKIQVPPVVPNQPTSFELRNDNPIAFFALSSNSVPSQVARIIVNINNPPAGDWNMSIDVRGPAENNFYSAYSPPASVRYILDPLIANIPDGIYQIRVSLYSERGDARILAEGQTIQATLIIEEIPVVPLGIGSTVSGTLDDNTPSLYYRFDSNMSELISLIGEQPTDSHPISVIIYDTFGFSMMSGSTVDYMDGSNTGRFVIDPLRTINQGTHYIGVSRATYYGADDATGKISPFTLSLNTTATPMLQPSIAVTGVFDDPQIYEYVYRYQGTANQTIRITLTSLNDGYAPAFDLIGMAFESPDSNIANITSIAPGKVIYEVKLEYDNVYLIRVRNSILYSFEDVKGAYSLQVDVVP